MTNKAAITDDVIEQRLAQVRRMRAEVSAEENPRYKTNRAWAWVEGENNRMLNLAVTSDAGVLLKMAAHLRAGVLAYAEAAAALRVENPPPYVWNGYSAGDWLHDIQARIDQIQARAKHDKLAALEARLTKLVSEDRRREKELEAIDAEMAAG